MKSSDNICHEDHDEFMVGQLICFPLLSLMGMLHKSLFIFPQYLALITVGIGLLFMLIFHIGVKEKPRKCSYLGSTKGKRNASNWKLWFKESEFYKVLLITL
jgi:hypothetical protein